ncbi:unnamed protein product [Effrenium voratum]|uniref:Uncharacterized protein n=1 Tax=Effrenium voratum TaxID=2562239 RepID=A0AA36HW85_9DINO|nr:unnamed protein product [Effrenium voratum]CAJ1375940.1 unnamed protein product [Effrenium voratum]
MAGWADGSAGNEVLVLCRFPQLEGFEGGKPVIVVDGAWRFKGQHQRPHSTNIFFEDAELQGASPHVVELELDRTGLASRPERAGGAERVRAPKHMPPPLEAKSPEPAADSETQVAVGATNADAAPSSSAPKAEAKAVVHRRRVKRRRVVRSSGSE